ncbi:hypothetical protein [Pseudomonas sp. NFX98]
MIDEILEHCPQIDALVISVGSGGVKSQARQGGKRHSGFTSPTDGLT